ncbi:MAG: hypothetical protein C0404_10435 [Verrucomicrobia bacterium]|nr:hypothetical protein [Verrucomicrobiota bacterium]
MDSKITQLTMVAALFMQCLGAIGLYCWGFWRQSISDFGVRTLWTTDLFVGFFGSAPVVLILFALSTFAAVGVVLGGKSERRALTMHFCVVCMWLLLIALQSYAMRAEFARVGEVVGSADKGKVPNHGIEHIR